MTPVGDLIQERADTAANWTSTNPILAENMFGYESDTRKMKIGDGVTAWNSLPYGTAEAAQVANNGSDFASPGRTRYNLHVAVLSSAHCLETANVASRSGLGAHDGYTPTDGEQVLLVGQTTASQNGPWVVHSGAWTRPTDFPAGGVSAARTITIINGTVHTKESWLLQVNGTITIDTTAQTWVQQSGGGIVGGGKLYVQTGAPSSPVDNDLWVTWT